MMTKNLAALIRCRIEQAEGALVAARLLLREHSLRASVNRSYYAMFYAILALLASRKDLSRQGCCRILAPVLLPKGMRG